MTGGGNDIDNTSTCAVQWRATDAATAAAENDGEDGRTDEATVVVSREGGREGESVITVAADAASFSAETDFCGVPSPFVRRPHAAIRMIHQAAAAAAPSVRPSVRPLPSVPFARSPRALWRVVISD